MTRFDQVIIFLSKRIVMSWVYCADGLWLIENGKISRPVKNMVFVESVLFALNNVEQLGTSAACLQPTTELVRDSGAHDCATAQD